MYFLFQDRLVTIYQIKKTFEENHGHFHSNCYKLRVLGHLGKR